MSILQSLTDGLAAAASLTFIVLMMAIGGLPGFVLTLVAALLFA